LKRKHVSCKTAATILLRAAKAAGYSALHGWLTMFLRIYNGSLFNVTLLYIRHRLIMKLMLWLSLMVIPVLLALHMPAPCVAGNTIPIISEHAEKSTEKEAPSAPESNQYASPSLYQINFSSQQPICNLIIGEYSTGQIIAAWRPASQISAPGKYYVIAASGELFVLIINNSINGGGQLLSLFSRYANRLRIRMDYHDKTFEEALSALPFTLHNCTLEAAESCMPGTIVPDPYQNCNPSLSGFIEIIITDSGGSWDKFKKNVVRPLQRAQEWLPSEVWLYLYQKVNKGYYAEVRITTNQCIRLVAEKLQGNPTILSSNGRQLNIHYR
jgi:hypothetical protein